MKIYVIFGRHRRIKGVFERPHLEWSVQRGEAVHRYCMQHIVKKLYKEAEKSEKKENKINNI
jgi:hypothetical protein